MPTILYPISVAAGANKIPKSGAGGTIAAGYIPDLSATYLTPAAAALLYAPLSIFTAAAKIVPPSDSTTAVQITKNDGTTAVVTVDTTNSRVGIVTISPASPLDVTGGAAATESGNQVTNGDFSGGSTGWSTGANWSIGAGVATKTGGAANNLTQNIGAASGHVYRVKFDYTRSAGTLSIAVGSVTHTTTFNAASGSVDIYIPATGAGVLSFIGDSAFAGTIDNVVVTDLLASAANSTLRDGASAIASEIRITTAALLNFAMGVNANKFNTTGAQNVAIGSNALASNTTASNNVAIGNTALQFNTTGGSNIAIGGATLAVNTTGATNTAIGFQALNANTVANNNVGIGFQALFSNATNSSNVAIGSNVLRLLTGGQKNVAIGGGSLALSTAGDSNVAIGVSALASSLTGTGNVAIGNSAGGLETGSNKLYIHNTNSMTPLLWGDFSAALASINGALGVLNMNPRAALDVVGADALTTNFGLITRSTSAELITATNDRTFAGAGNWTGANWAVSSGVFLHTAGSAADAVLTSANMTASQIVLGNLYKVTFTVASWSTGTLTPKIGTAAGTAIASNATFVQYIVAAANDASLIFTPSSTFNGSIDNLSVLRLAVVFSVDNAGDHTLADAANIVLGTTTGTKFGTATTQKQGWWNAAPVIQQTDGAALVNNAVASGTTNQIDDFTSLTIYATDAQAIHNDIYQLARKVKIMDDALRLYGMLS